MEDLERTNKELGILHMNGRDASTPLDLARIEGPKDVIDELCAWAAAGVQFAKSVHAAKALEVDQTALEENGLAATNYVENEVDREISAEIQLRISRGEDLVSAASEDRFDHEVKGDHPKSSENAGFIIDSLCFVLDKTADGVSIINKVLKKKGSLGEDKKPFIHIVE